MGYRQRWGSVVLASWGLWLISADRDAATRLSGLLASKQDQTAVVELRAHTQVGHGFHPIAPQHKRGEPRCGAGSPDSQRCPATYPGGGS